MGMKNVSELGIYIWNRFYNKWDELKEYAEEILSNQRIKIEDEKYGEIGYPQGTIYLIYRKPLYVEWGKAE